MEIFGTTGIINRQHVKRESAYRIDLMRECCYEHRISICELIDPFLHVYVNADEHASTAEENGHWFIVSITLSSLLAFSLLVNIGLAVAVIRVKGNSSCTKG